MKADNVYFGGVPTEPDVKKLRDAFPDDALEVGILATYDEVAKVIGVNARANRFITVTTAWRKKVELDTGKIIEPSEGKFIVLSESEKLELQTRRLREAGKKARRVVVVGNLIDRKKLSEDERRVKDRNDMVSGKMMAVGQLREHHTNQELEPTTRKRSEAT